MTAYNNSTDFYVYQRVWFLLTSLFPQPNKSQFLCIMLMPTLPTWAWDPGSNLAFNIITYSITTAHCTVMLL